MDSETEERILRRAELVLGTREAARDWLNTPNRALAGARPVDLLNTSDGEVRVLQVLGRIEHGVYD